MDAARPDPLRIETVVDRATTPAPARVGTAPARKLEREWEALADRVCAPPFLHPGWVHAWTKAYADGPLTVLTTRDRTGGLSGVLPLIRRRRTSRAPSNSHTPLAGPLAADPDAASELAERLLAEMPGRVVLSPADPSDATTAAFERTLRSAGQLVLAETVARSPYVPLHGAFDDYVKGLSKNLRKQIGRRRRRLEESGHVSVEVQTSTHGLQSALDDFVALESSGWKEGSGTAIASRAASRVFYTELATWGAERGWLRLSFLALDGRPIATELALAHDGVLYALKSGFDPEYRSFGPGQLLTYESLSRAFADGLSSYEFLGFDEGYKLDWASEARELVRLQAFPRTLGGRVRLLAERRGRPLWRRLRRA
jgi:CelD/BcsL family acetyltransferase involved in cellulose biosynthesis